MGQHTHGCTTDGWGWGDVSGGGVVKTHAGVARRQQLAGLQPPESQTLMMDPAGPVQPAAKHGCK